VVRVLLEVLDNQEQLALVEHQAVQDHLEQEDPLDLLGALVKPGEQDLLDRPGNLVLQVHQEHQELVFQ
jgi:hypothetical protein